MARAGEAGEAGRERTALLVHGLLRCGLHDGEDGGCKGGPARGAGAGGAEEDEAVVARREPFRDFLQTSTSQTSTRRHSTLRFRVHQSVVHGVYCAFVLSNLTYVETTPGADSPCILTEARGTAAAQRTLNWSCTHGSHAYGCALNTNNMNKELTGCAGGRRTVAMAVMSSVV